jgi:hypothetical protein
MPERTKTRNNRFMGDGPPPAHPVFFRVFFLSGFRDPDLLSNQAGTLTVLILPPGKIAAQHAASIKSAILAEHFAGCDSDVLPGRALRP